MNNVTTVFGKRIVSQIVHYCLFLIILTCLSACSAASYDRGKFPDDLPATIASIYLEDVTPLSEESVSTPKANNIQTSYAAPSTDAVFVAKVVQSEVALDLMRKGYKVTHNPLEDHDICITIFLFYQPDDWPLANRYIHLSAEVSRPNGAVLLHAETIRENWFGSLGDYIGFSGENMMADTAHQLVDLIVGHLQ